MGDSNRALDDWEKPFKSEKKRITNEVHQKFSKAKSDTTFAFVLFMLIGFILVQAGDYHSESWFPVLAVILAILPFYWERQEIKKSNFPRKLLVATNQHSPIIEEYIAEKCESIPGYTEAREEAEEARKKAVREAWERGLKEAQRQRESLIRRRGTRSSPSRKNRWLPSNDDDINSVDGGPPSEAYDDASDDDG